MKIELDLHGMRIDVDGDAGAVDEVRRDFAWFARGGATAALRMTLHARRPPYDDLPAVDAAFSTPRNWCFRDGATSWLDYFGRGLTVHDRGAGTLALYSDDHDLLHEMAYLAILSLAGQDLDRRGLHRLHALGVEYGGRAILLLLPSGGGKSTTALRLLERPGYRLLGEDTPLVDQRGDVHAFPLRLGVRPESKPDVPPAFLRTMSRMEFDPKLLIDIAYFGDRIATRAPPALLLVGRRNLGTGASMAPLGSIGAFRALTSNLVVGLGVYQGLEFLLERDAWELAGKLGLVTSRARASLALLRRADAFRFTMGRDIDRNIDTLIAFVESRLGAPAPAASD